jgi:hypothetical protein
MLYNMTIIRINNIKILIIISIFEMNVRYLRHIIGCGFFVSMYNCVITTGSNNSNFELNGGKNYLNLREHCML